MKQSKQQRLKPLSSSELKKFDRKYQSMKREIYNQIHQGRLEAEKQRTPYVPPSISKIGEEAMKEDLKRKELEKAKQAEIIDSIKKRDKYCMLVRDLHQPKVSELKKIEVEK